MRQRDWQVRAKVAPGEWQTGVERRPFRFWRGRDNCGLRISECGLSDCGLEVCLVVVVCCSLFVDWGLSVVVKGEKSSFWRARRLM